MKNSKLIILTILGLLFGLFACEDEEFGPVLDNTATVAPQLTDPSDGAGFILKKDSATETLATFIWSTAEYSLENVPNIIYTFEMDVADSNFNNPATLAVTENLSVDITVGEMNNKLMAKTLEHSVAHNMEFRVKAVLSENMDPNYSSVITIPITPYSSEIVADTIYILGDATDAGWDNTLALPMTNIAEGQYAIVALLQGGKYLKFIDELGQWAPQWGTDAEGTPEAGNLVFRETEDIPDPAAIETPDSTGDYLIIADIVDLTYTITKDVETLHIIGDATDAVWDNSQAVVMTKDAPGKFSLVANLSADASEGFKFLEFQGAWAPMYGQDGNGTWESGKLQFRPTESADDPSSIPPPPTTGSYLIEVDIAAGTYKVTAQ